MNIEAIIKRQQQFGTARADADTIHIVFGSDANYARPMPGKEFLVKNCLAIIILNISRDCSTFIKNMISGSVQKKSND